MKSNGIPLMKDHCLKKGGISEVDLAPLKQLLVIYIHMHIPDDLSHYSHFLVSPGCGHGKQGGVTDECSWLIPITVPRLRGGAWVRGYIACSDRFSRPCLLVRSNRECCTERCAGHCEG